jgi:hypothetical protein
MRRGVAVGPVPVGEAIVDGIIASSKGNDMTVPKPLRKVRRRSFQCPLIKGGFKLGYLTILAWFLFNDNVIDAEKGLEVTEL